MVGSNLEAKLEGRKMERVYTTSLIFNSGTQNSGQVEFVNRHNSACDWCKKCSESGKSTKLGIVALWGCQK